MRRTTVLAGAVVALAGASLAETAPAVAAPTRSTATRAPQLAVLFIVGSTSKVRRLALTAVPGATAVVTCAGDGCPAGPKRFTVPSGGARNLAVRFEGRSLRPGARITVTVSTPGLMTRRYTLRVRARRVPLASVTLL